MQSPQEQSHKRLRYFLAVLFLFSMLGLGQWGVIDTSEARYAHIAKGMYESGDYVHPVYLGVEHYHKPPLTYQLTALAYEILGPSPFAARFLLQLALFLQCMLIYLIGREILHKRDNAFYAVGIYLSFAIVWISVRNLTTDAYLTTWLLASIWALVLFAKRNSQKHLYMLAVFGGLGFLTKITAFFVIAGPVALAILWAYRGKYRWTFHIVGAAALFAAVVSTWFIALGNEGWEIFRYLLYDQSVVRYTADVFFRNQPWWYYLATVPALSLPWVIVAASFAGKRKDLQVLTGLLLLVGFLFPVLFYSLSKSKLILYVLPGFPLLALFCADHIELLGERSLQLIKVSGLALGLVLVISIGTFPIIDPVWKASAVLIVVCALSIVALAAAYLTTPAREGSVVVPAAAMILVAGAACWLIGANQEQVPSLKVVTDWLENNGLEDRQILIYDKLMPSAAFHSRSKVSLVHDQRDNARRELQFEEDEQWQQYYFDINVPADSARLAGLMRDTPVVVVVPRPRNGSIKPGFAAGMQESVVIGRWDIYY